MEALACEAPDVRWPLVAVGPGGPAGFAIAWFIGDKDPETFAFQGGKGIFIGDIVPDINGLVFVGIITEEKFGQIVDDISKLDFQKE